MSLINKMLQDLDARGTLAGEAIQLHIKPVAREERRLPVRPLLAAIAGAVALAALGATGWHYLHKRAAAPQPRPVTVVMTPPPEHPAGVAPTAVLAAPAVVPAGSAREAAPAAHDHTSPAKPASLARAQKRAEKKDEVREKANKAKVRKAKLPEERREKAVAAQAAAASNIEHAAPDGRQETAGQRAEGAYRRGLASLQDGRVTDAIGALRQALQADPRHEAARQTLVGLLIENGQADDAIRQLQLGLTLDPRQPALAMLLARLQIEGGGSGIETLMRTLPYAAGNGEYHAFLAGALQRQQRHREAAEQYQAALRSAPQKGVWWMGLGISLQADKRDAEALDAFQKAKATGTLSPELLAFVERKLRQPGL